MPFSLNELLGRLVALGLSVGWGAGEAVGLDTQVVRVHVHVEEAPIAPVGSPRVTANPVLLTIFGLAVTDYSNGVVELRCANVFLVNSGAVILVKGIGGLDAA